jgi:hypothetical protein
MNIYGLINQLGWIKLKDKMNIKDTLLKSLQSKMPRDTESLKDMNTISSKLKTESEEFDEATGSGSAGGFEAPLFGEMNEDDYCDVCNKVKSKCDCKKIKKVETKEATGASSSGQYSGPSFLAKSTSKKNWRGRSKTQIPGGKFVQVKKKCLKFPYCNQGDINALKLTELDVFENIVKKLALEYKIDENLIKKLIREDILKNMNI